MSKAKSKPSHRDYKDEPPNVWNRSSSPSPEQFAFELAFVQVYLNRFYKWLGETFTVDQVMQNREAIADIASRLAAGLTSWARQAITIRGREISQGSKKE